MADNAEAAHLLLLTVRVTAETPSTNLVRKMTLALLNMPSFRETTMNCEYGKCVLIMCPMFCVWLRSSAASTCSVRSYIESDLPYIEYTVCVAHVHTAQGQGSLAEVTRGSCLPSQSGSLHWPKVLGLEPTWSHIMCPSTDL